MLQGFDFAWGSFTVAGAKANGWSFVCRYLSGGNSKDITATELHNWVTGGIQVVFVWETTGTDMTSYANGVNDALAANAELNRIGAAGSPVFFACDEQFTSDLVGYMRGVNSVLGIARSGIYGGLNTISVAFNNGVVKYGWQTYAWSGGAWDNRALLRQYLNGSSYDHDEAAFWSSPSILTTSSDYGQWPRPSSPTPVPPGPIQEPVLSIGATGSAVVLLQQLLQVHGSPQLVADGVFGPITQYTVRGFQRYRGLTVDGIVGPQTWSALDKRYV
jgi:hypothetical protein